MLEQASGHGEALDLWMAGEAWCQQQLYLAAQTADTILIEGARGMFDGEPSSADLAARFSIPIAIVMDVKGMAQTAAAIVTGLAISVTTLRLPVCSLTIVALNGIAN